MNASLHRQANGDLALVQEEWQFRTVWTRHCAWRELRLSVGLLGLLMYTIQVAKAHSVIQIDFGSYPSRLPIIVFDGASMRLRER